jgi:ADP-heptose:LPS heptosyltransferase
MAKTVDLTGKRVLISRTDSIGDVLLTLPICAWLKKEFPGVEVLFLGKGYTQSVVESYSEVDRFLNWEDFLNAPKTEKIQTFRALELDAVVHVFPDKEIAALAKKARVPVRVGTSHRAYHLVTCTHRVNFTRKNSKLHEAQLNHELLRPFGLQELPELNALIETTEHFKVPQVALPKSCDFPSPYVILHPKSQGSALEWPLEKYGELAMGLAERGKTVVFTGTEAEGKEFRAHIPTHSQICDTSGQLTLAQLIVLISKAETLVACSTGPLHIAAYTGIQALGLYVPRRPIHPGRWSPIGPKAEAIVYDEKCPKCAARKPCDCITQIPVEVLLEKIV